MSKKSGSTMVADIDFLISQLDTMENFQDRDAIAKIAARYGIKRLWEKSPEEIQQLGGIGSKR